MFGLSLSVFLVAGVQGEGILYPFGEEYGDHPGIVADDSFDEVTLSHSYSFYEETYHTLFVSVHVRYVIGSVRYVSDP